MFTLLKPVLTTLAVLTMLTVAQAADYESMSTQELSQLRGTMYNKSDEERDAFRSVWQQRINQMSEEEKANYLGWEADGGKVTDQARALATGPGEDAGTVSRAKVSRVKANRMVGGHKLAEAAGRGVLS